MSKGQGKKIVVKFSEAIQNEYITFEEYVKPSKIVNMSSDRGRSYGTNLPSPYDGSTGSYYGTTSSTIWFLCELPDEHYPVVRFRFYNGASYRPRAFRLEGSHDGSEFTEVTSGEQPNSTGWQEYTFENTENYKFYRLNITSRWSSRIYVYEFEFYWLAPTLQPSEAFTVTSQRERYIGSGIYDTQTHSVYTTEYHPTLDSKHIVLNIPDYPTFKNAVGNVKVEYNHLVGTLYGNGGVVESFTHEFLPQDLEPVPNPHYIEDSHITVGATITKELKQIYHINRYEGDSIITVGASIEYVLTDVSVVNP